MTVTLISKIYMNLVIEFISIISQTNLHFTFLSFKIRSAGSYSNDD